MSATYNPTRRGPPPACEDDRDGDDPRVHAHPDDEVLLTGGTLARLAAEGHRVVVVVACAGGLGRVSPRGR
jgi:hypothetical protein